MKTYTRLFKPVFFVDLLAIAGVLASGIFLSKRDFLYIGGGLLAFSVIFTLIFWMYISRRLKKFSIDV